MNIIMYTKVGCPWCDQARYFLESQNIPFVEKECRNNKEHFDELIRKSGQTLTPTLDVDGDILADTDAPAIADFLKKKGVEGL